MERGGETDTDQGTREKYAIADRERQTEKERKTEGGGWRGGERGRGSQESRGSGYVRVELGFCRKFQRVPPVEDLAAGADRIVCVEGRTTDLRWDEGQMRRNKIQWRAETSTKMQDGSV
eukprot:764949-Hanusia_phi.AAC.8